VSGFLQTTAKSFKVTSRFRIVVLHNYFSVLYPLSSPPEITVLPLKASGDAKWDLTT